MLYFITCCVIGVLSLCAPTAPAGVMINFDDVVGSQQDITTRYIAMGVTLNAIDNVIPITGPYPAPATLPLVRGGATTWTQGFASAVSPPQVAIAAATPQTPNAGDGGILISFAFDVATVSLVGNDLGRTTGDDEFVTLTAYNALGNRIGQTFSTAKLSGFDRVSATISIPGMRYVAYNYTNTNFGFYAIDNLFFDTVPEPASALGAAGLLVILAGRRSRLSHPVRVARMRTQ